jgi:hypothetical protein
VNNWKSHLPPAWERRESGRKHALLTSFWRQKREDIIVNLFEIVVIAYVVSNLRADKYPGIDEG